MPPLNTPRKKSTLLLWAAAILLGLILIFGLDRNPRHTINLQSQQTLPTLKITVPPALRARQMIAKLRTEGPPFPLGQIFEKATDYQQQGSLADAHLLFFFGAREGDPAAMMKMAEIADPTRFRAEDSLLNQADVVQAYQWYHALAEQGHTEAQSRIQSLRTWAESQPTNPEAQQLLLLMR